MADVIGRGTIELVGDARRLKASIEDARKSIRTLGEGQKDISKSASQSIDKYIGRLQAQNAMLGKSSSETELYKLSLRGASNEQMNAASAALRVRDSHIQQQAALESLNSGFIKLAAGITIAAAAYGALAVQNINFADHLKDLSKSTDISVENLAGLSLLAKQTGTDLDGLAKGINKMSVEMGKDPAGFRALGITAKDSMGAFEQFSDIFNLLPDINQRNALAQKVFSKSWAELAPALSEGGKKIGEVIEKGARLSGITKEIADRADEFNDKLAELKISAAALGTEFIPVLTNIINQLLAAREGADGFLSSLSRFFSISGAQVNAPAIALEEIDGKLVKLKKTSADFAAMGAFKRAFSADDIAIVEAQIQRLETQRDMLSKLLPPSKQEMQGPPAPADLLARQKAAAARAAAFLKGPGEASALSKAQLDFDLAQIKKASDATIGTFANAERIMQAMRSAGLVDEKAYYASKLGFITLNSQAHEAELQKEIARLEREKFTGKDAVKDKLENDKKIVEAQGKLTKVRADAVANVEINSIQEAAALRNIAQAYRDAEIAAQAYLDVILRGQARELAGMGAGSLERDRTAGRAQIEDKYSSELKALNNSRVKSEFAGTFGPEAQKKYDDELERIRRFQSLALGEFDKYFAERLKKESDWSTGASEALRNYYDESRNIAKQTENLFTKAFQGMEDALVDFVTTGKLDFNSLANSIVADITRIIIKQQIANAVMSTMGSGGKDFFSLIGNMMGPSTQAPAPVSDAVLSWGGRQAAGGDYIVTKPTLFLAGEAGPERASFSGAGKAGGGSNVQINVINKADPVQVQQSAPRIDAGQMVIDVVLTRLHSDVNVRNSMRSALGAPA